MGVEAALDRILFLDIETVSQHSSYNEVPENVKPLWRQKAEWFARRNNEEWTEEVGARIYGEKAGIYAEFGKVVVISVGYLLSANGVYSLKLKSFASDNEQEVLSGFSQLISKHYNNPSRQFLCGHNIKEFDIPFICRRMVINGMALPEMINVTGKKPWETKHLLDTMDLWRFGDLKNYTSLSLLAHVLGVPTPKDDIDGSDVGRVFWEENDLHRIAVYCEKDVATCARVLLKFQGEAELPDEQVHSLSDQIS